MTSASRGSENAAYPRERLGAANNHATLSVLRDQLSAFTGRRGAWVSVRRQHLRGLVGTRPRGGNAAWEIDYLLDATPDREVTADLLDRAVAQVGQHGAQKLFLRLPAESDLLKPALQAGFIAYQREVLFVSEIAPAASPAPVDGLRSLAPSDSYPLFRLYCSATPEPVRRFEAASFDEWHAAQERQWQKNGNCLILQRDDVIRASVRACRLPQGLMLDLLFDSAAVADVPGLVSAAMSSAGSADCTVLALLPQTAEGAISALQAAGFTPREEFVSVVRRTTKPLALPREVPVVAKNAVGA